MMMGQCKGRSHKMVVLPALSRPSTRIRASFSPKIDSRRETHSPIPAAPPRRSGDDAAGGALPEQLGLQQAHTLLGKWTHSARQIGEHASVSYSVKPSPSQITIVGEVMRLVPMPGWCQVCGPVCAPL